ncbi:MAG: hypothetical protein HY401_02355 [Elusimicrobia bacterium]|nr:hypothetical protein [Elusimicrobiota bacterium]
MTKLSSIFLNILTLLNFLNLSPAFADELRGGEPHQLDYFEGFSEVTEPFEKLPQERIFSGETKWRFKADKPNAETFGVTTPGRFINPLYLYNRTSLAWRPRAGQETTLNWTLLRRDETSTGASEPPVTADRRNLALRHLTLGHHRQGRDVYAGDFAMGWGQGLVMAGKAGLPYRPFLWKNHQAEIAPNRSSYENTGLRGAAILIASSDARLGGFVAQTPLHGERSEQGDFLEDYAVLSQDAGEFGSHSRLARRNTLKEKSVGLRFEQDREPVNLGASVVHVDLNRRVQHDVSSVNAPGLPNRQAYLFQGKKIGIFGIDLGYRVGENTRLLAEAAASFWGKRRAPAFAGGWLREQSGFKDAAGVFLFAPRYVSRLADGPRMGGGVARNRRGLFYSRIKRLGHHEAGGHLYFEQNLESEFSGSTLSHSPPDRRLSFKGRADDRVGFSRGFFGYFRLGFERDPYFVHATKNPVVSMIEERSVRLEAGREKSRGSWALGTDYLRVTATRFPSERSEGQDAYGRLNWKIGRGTKLLAKLAYFDLGSPLFGSRSIFLSSPEFYWRQMTLSSIAYQSLFASYAPEGWRWALALEQDMGERVSFWVKWGTTMLGRDEVTDTPKTTTERDDLISQTRSDFKTEIIVRW